MDAIKTNPENPVYHVMNAEGKPHGSMKVASLLWKALSDDQRTAFNL